MTKKAFEDNVLDLMDTMHRVSKCLLVRQHDREDAIQSCLLKAWHKRDALRDPSLFRPWILRILVNECHSLLRKSMWMVYVELPEASQELPDSTLHEAIAALPKRHRLPLLLFYIEGLSVKETAQVLHIPEGTVKSRLFKARNALKTAIKWEV